MCTSSWTLATLMSLRAWQCKPTLRNASLSTVSAVQSLGGAGPCNTLSMCYAITLGLTGAGADIRKLHETMRRSDITVIPKPRSLFDTKDARSTLQRLLTSNTASKEHCRCCCKLRCTTLLRFAVVPATPSAAASSSSTAAPSSSASATASLAYSGKAHAGMSPGQVTHCLAALQERPQGSAAVMALARHLRLVPTGSSSAHAEAPYTLRVHDVSQFMRLSASALTSLHLLPVRVVACPAVI